MLIKLENVTKKYKKLIFNDVSIELLIEDIVCLNGDSGSGKTTLCNMILQFDNNFKGKITANTDILNMSFMPQSNKLLLDMTVLENIISFTEPENLDKVDDILKKLGIPEIFIYM